MANFIFLRSNGWLCTFCAPTDNCILLELAWMYCLNSTLTTVCPDTTFMLFYSAQAIIPKKIIEIIIKERYYKFLDNRAVRKGKQFQDWLFRNVFQPIHPKMLFMWHYQSYYQRCPLVLNKWMISGGAELCTLNGEN